MPEASGSWRNDRLETSYVEARTVIEAQNATMADIDDKAVQTVRFNAVLVGLLLAAANAAGPSIFHPQLFVGGIVSPTASILFGLVTYNESDLFVGPSGRYIATLVRAETVDSWDVDLVESLAGMVSKNSDEVIRNSRLLTITQALLVSGVVSSVLSVGI